MEIYKSCEGKSEEEAEAIVSKFLKDVVEGKITPYD